MRMRRLASMITLIAFAVSPASATAPVPRKSPEVTFFGPSGKPTQLSSLRGKVVLIEFLLTNCPHCLRVEQTIAKLQWELGSRGFQPLGIAFDSNINNQKIADFTRQFAATYPIGYISAEKVDAYLGRTRAERFRVPQIVVIDRKGVIRAQSHPTGEKDLEDEAYLRNLINTLLNER